MDAVRSKLQYPWHSVHSALMNIIVPSGGSVQEVPKRLNRPLVPIGAIFRSSATLGAGFGANQCRKIDRPAPEVRRFVVARARNAFGRFTAGAAGFLNS
jgi:hypothetical protein